MSTEMNLVVTRGCTLKSGEIYSVNEPVPSNITYEQLMAGIADGTYTLKSLANKTYRGQVRDRANTAIKAELVFTTLGDKLVFTVPASVTETWINEAATFFYDVFETDTITEEVIQVVHGKITVNAAITIEGL